MTWSKRSTRFALTGYLLVAALVVGGLAWTTAVSLRLEGAQLAEGRWTDYHNRLRLALSRLDRRMQSTINRESRRQTRDYAASFNPLPLWDYTGTKLDR